MVRARRRSQDAGGRLPARPGEPRGTVPAGLHRLDVGEEGEALLAVPAGYRPEQPAPFILSLHGAGGNATSGLYPLYDLVDEAGLILLSPAARGRTWDVILGGFGPDIAVIDRALRAAFDRCAVDPRHMGIAGFSDGGSYALSLGITNGDLFPRVLAFSPRLCRSLRSARNASLLRLPWDRGPSPADRSHEPADRAPARGCWLRRALSRICRRAHRSPSNRARGIVLVPGRVRVSYRNSEPVVRYCQMAGCRINGDTRSGCRRESRRKSRCRTGRVRVLTG